MGSKRNRFKRRLQVLLHQIQHAAIRLGSYFLLNLLANNVAARRRSA